MSDVFETRAWTLERTAEQQSLVETHFDPDYYRAEYPDIDASPTELLRHFLFAGWREGRNPNADFDTVTYLREHGQAIPAGENPFVHYLTTGRDAGLAAAPAATPSICTMLLFGMVVTDWVERLRPYVDLSFYRRALPAADLDAVDPVAHFAYRGWRFGLSPNRDFNVAAWLVEHPGAAGAGVNPVLVAIVRGGADAAGGAIASRSEPATEPEISSWALAAMAQEFARTYYLRNNPDVAATGIDPLLHFASAGWRERRKPNAAFDTTYYLSAYEDVARAGVNPFLHFVTEGRREGRLPACPGGKLRQVIDAARPPSEKSRDYARADAATLLDEAQLLALGMTTAVAPSGIVLAFSHDCYVRHVGGVQILISDEEARFTGQGWAYVQVSPLAPGLALLDGVRRLAVNVVLNGKFAGAADLVELVDVLGTATLRDRIAIVHSLLGFDTDTVGRAIEQFGAGRRFFWIHDYSPLCSGFNLLRNDIVHCHAPPVGSMACRVCVYGRSRPAHLAAVQSLFAEVGFDVIAPSASALETWRQAVSWPHRSRRIIPHWLLRRSEQIRRAGSDGPLAIAFVGYPVPAKGWATFLELVDRLSDDPGLRFLHFCGSESTCPSVVDSVRVEVRRDSRHAMIDRLREEAVDWVVMLSPWRETFSFVAHEAILAGCMIACLQASGNVAAVVRETGYGRVFDDADALIAFFTGQDAWSMARDIVLPVFELDSIGTTFAALDAALPAEISE